MFRVLQVVKELDGLKLYERLVEPLRLSGYGNLQSYSICICKNEYKSYYVLINQTAAT